MQVWQIAPPAPPPCHPWRIPTRRPHTSTDAPDFATRDHRRTTKPLPWTAVSTTRAQSRQQPPDHGRRVSNGGPASANRDRKQHRTPFFPCGRRLSNGVLAAMGTPNQLTSGDPPSRSSPPLQWATTVPITEIVDGIMECADLRTRPEGFTFAQRFPALDILRRASSSASARISSDPSLGP